MTAADIRELVAASRARQGLPATVEDATTIRRLARLVLAARKRPDPVSETTGIGPGGRRAAGDPQSA